MDYSLPGCLVHGILQAGILEWVAAMLFSSGSSCPPASQAKIFICWATREAPWRGLEPYKAPERSEAPSTVWGYHQNAKSVTWKKAFRQLCSHHEPGLPASRSVRWKFLSFIAIYFCHLLVFFSSHLNRLRHTPPFSEHFTSVNSLLFLLCEGKFSIQKPPAFISVIY